jgi:hypothetical protein
MAGGGRGGSAVAGRGGTGGAVDGGSLCAADVQFACAAGSPLSCSDALQSADCVSGQWQCPVGTIPFSQCICVGAPPPGCSCGATGWFCSDGGAGRGGAGAGGKGGTGGGTGGVSCGNTTCTAGNVCVRQQTEGGACFPPEDGGCPQGTSPGNPCCVRDPSYTCKPLPAACNGTLSCDCARQPLCTSANVCATPTASEIDCTLQVP